MKESRVGVSEVISALTEAERAVGADAHTAAVRRLEKILTGGEGFTASAEFELKGKKSRRAPSSSSSSSSTPTEAEDHHIEKMANLFANELSELQQGDSKFGGSDEELTILRLCLARSGRPC
jgi:hypothetical protein